MYPFVVVVPIACIVERGYVTVLNEKCVYGFHILDELDLSRAHVNDGQHYPPLEYDVSIELGIYIPN